MQFLDEYIYLVVKAKLQNGNVLVGLMNLREKQCSFAPVSQFPTTNHTTLIHYVFISQKTWSVYVIIYCLTQNLWAFSSSSEGGHKLLSLDELSAELKSSLEPLKVKAEERFENLGALEKELAIIQSQWDVDTDANIRFLNKKKADQVYVMSGVKVYDRLAHSNQVICRTTCFYKLFL